MNYKIISLETCTCSYDEVIQNFKIKVYYLLYYFAHLEFGNIEKNIKMPTKYNAICLRNKAKADLPVNDDIFFIKNNNLEWY